ncbi:hypothetical protein L596_010403 [Steinernema carpocapsae]|uniref:Uncharacterized protein n=1 Tax=Steinernema carpocapsae TaxID=34508 RepID=A0A4U5PIG7_STECR|nr:hypothetical protein L596_010403 [Steinernema carpocapsae]
MGQGNVYLYDADDRSYSTRFIASRLKLRCITIDDNPTPIITNEQPQPQRQLQLQRSQQQRKRLKPLRQLQVLRIPI